MVKSQLSGDEAARLASLYGLDILDTPPEPEFDALAQSASLVCGVPISMVTLVDVERQWFKAKRGMPEDVTETPRDIAFCSHAILSDEMLEVPDATADARFVDNPLVTKDGGIRFYAGVPLRLSDGSRVGTLCVIDRQPKRLDDQQREVLHCLAKVAVKALENRRTAALQRQATIDLINSEARFRTLCDGSPNGIFYTNPEGRSIYTNQRWQEIFGLTLEESYERGWSEILHPEDGPDVIAEWRHTAALRRDFDMTFRFIRPDGSIRRVHSRARPVFCPDGGEVLGFVGSTEDITEHHDMMQRLAASEERLRRLYEATPAMLHSIDSQGHLLMVSDAWLAKLGYKREEVIGRHVLEFVTPRSRDYARTIVQPAFFKTGRSTNIEYEVVTKSGAIVIVLLSAVADRNEDGSFLRSLTVMEDITTRRKAETAMRESEARYKMLASSTTDVITQLDFEFKRRYVSPACQTVYGYSPEEMLGERPSTLIHPDDRDRVQALAAELSAGLVPGDRATTLYRAQHKNGHWIWLEAGIGLVRDSLSGKPQSLISSVRDVSDRQRVARDLERAKAVAEHAAQMQAEFVANMTHELRTPLTGILGFHDLLRQGPALAPKQQRYLDLAHEAGRSLLAIVNDVLDFSKIEAGELSIEKVPFDLQALVEICRDLGHEAGRTKSVPVISELACGPLSLVGDPVRIKQILLNLITNAVKFTGEGHVNVKAVYGMGHLRIEVADTGIGIPQDKLSLLFKRFSQADGSITRRYGGTGLGLAICKSLVSLMGGEIGVYSETDVGSTFWFELPLAVTERRASLSPTDQSGARGRRRILLAEDNPLNQEILTQMLEQRGHAVIVVDNGAAAVAAVQGETFDLVLMDMQMPIMDGLTATRTIREAEKTRETAPVPIIALTANAMASEVARCRQAGMDAHVAKPVEWARLFAVMDEVAAPARANGTLALSDDPTGGVFDIAHLQELASIFGKQRAHVLLGDFAVEIERQILLRQDWSGRALYETSHTVLSIAGQFGFVELWKLCAEIQVEGEICATPDHVAALRAAAERAVAVARGFAFAETGERFALPAAEDDVTARLMRVS